RQLTSGARAHLPAVTPDGCVLFVRDVVSEGASLRRWCRPTAAGPGSIVWRAPHGVHIVGLAVSQAGRVVLSVWRQGFVDLALLEGGRLEFLTQDAAPDLDPAWQGDERLVFRSARRADGVFQLYALGIGSGRLTQLSSTLGGAFQPVPLDGGLLYVELGTHGSNLARLARPLRRVAPIRFEALPPARAPAAAYAVRTYDPLPSLLPYGWLPTGGRFRVDPLGFGLQAAVLGQDLSGRHSYALTLGYDSSLRGLLGGAYANVRYEYGAPQLLGLLGSPAPVGFGVRLGWWPYTPHLMATTETALGLRGTLMLRLPLDRWLAQLRFGVGLVRLESFARHSPDDPWQLDGRLDAVLSNQHADDWGYRTRGLRLGLAGIWSATPAGPSPGLWGDVDLVLPLGNGALAAGLRAGYRQAPPFPVTLTSDLAATAHLAYHTSLPLGWRLGDGKLALERLSLTPRLESWWDTRPGLGADLTLGFDSVLGYGAPVAVTATFGYAEGFWYGLGLQLP
ncbi:MAG TPA: hypothetical protein VF171_04665, partial [Trueperaceae bacterium]